MEEFVVPDNLNSFGSRARLDVNGTGYDYFRPWDLRNEIHEFIGVVPFQGCHIAWGIVLFNGSFRKEGYPFGK